MTLKEQITNAFREVKYPGDDKIAIKEWYLKAEALDGYVGKKREDLTIDFINNGHRECTSFMTKEAFYYYLPTFMILCAESAYEMDIFSDRIIGKLTLPREEDHQRVLKFLNEEEGVKSEDAYIFPSNEDELKSAQYEFICFVKGLSKEQRQAIISFLQFFKDKYKDSMADAALDRFWGKLGR